jgi:hypothetical protein
VNPGAFTVTVNLQIPGTVLVDTYGNDVAATWTTDLGIGPVGYQPGTLSSQVTITVTCTEEVNNTWTTAAITGSVPNGAWVNVGNTMQTNGTTANALVGCTIIPVPQPPDVTAAVPQQKLLIASDSKNRHFEWSAVVAPSSDTYDQSQALSQLTSTINTTAASARNKILAALIHQGLSVPKDPSMPLFAAEAGDLLTAPPQLRVLGETSSSGLS